MDKTPRAPVLDEHLCFALYGASMAIGRAYRPILAAWGITYPQYLVLSALWEEDGRTVGGLAARLSLEPSTLTPLIGRLVNAGLVTRLRGEADGRQVIVRLTEEGRALAAERGRIAARLMEATGMDHARLARLNAEARELRDALEARLAEESAGS